MRKLAAENADISMSKITVGQWDKIAADLGINIADLQTFPTIAHAGALDGFVWDQHLAEPAQAGDGETGGYIRWVKAALNCTSVVVVKGSEVELSLPQLAAMSHRLHGKSDLLVLFHTVHQTPEARSGIIFVMELKKKVLLASAAARVF